MAKESWTLAELHQALQRFRAEAERAGLKPHTVDTYVGRSEQFVRWLAGDFTFRGPNEVDRAPMRHSHHRESLGRQSLDATDRLPG